MIFASEVPTRLTVQGRPVHSMSAIFDQFLAPGLACIFVDQRAVGRDGFAVVVADYCVDGESLIRALELDVPSISGFEIYAVSRSIGGHGVSLSHGDVVYIHYIVQRTQEELTEAISFLADGEPDGDSDDRSDSSSSSGSCSRSLSGSDASAENTHGSRSRSPRRSLERGDVRSPDEPCVRLTGLVFGRHKPPSRRLPKAGTLAPRVRLTAWRLLLFQHILGFEVFVQPVDCEQHCPSHWLACSRQRVMSDSYKPCWIAPAFPQLQRDQFFEPCGSEFAPSTPSQRKWSCALVVRCACLQGRCGDTSAWDGVTGAFCQFQKPGVSDISSLEQQFGDVSSDVCSTWIHSWALLLAFCTQSRNAFGLNVPLCWGLAFISALMPVSAVSLDACPSDDTTYGVEACTAGHSGQSPGGSASDATGLAYTDWADDVRPTDVCAADFLWADPCHWGTLSGAHKGFCTLLEEAKGEAFYKVCDELARFFSDTLLWDSFTGGSWDAHAFTISSLHTTLELAKGEAFVSTCREIFIFLADESRRSGRSCAT